MDGNVNAHDVGWRDVYGYKKAVGKISSRNKRENPELKARVSLEFFKERIEKVDKQR